MADAAERVRSLLGLERAADGSRPSTAPSLVLGLLAGTTTTIALATVGGWEGFALALVISALIGLAMRPLIARWR